MKEYKVEFQEIGRRKLSKECAVGSSKEEIEKRFLKYKNIKFINAIRIFKPFTSPILFVDKAAKCIVKTHTKKVEKMCVVYAKQKEKKLGKINS